jgi:hypothetical protein
MHGRVLVSAGGESVGVCNTVSSRSSAGEPSTSCTPVGICNYQMGNLCVGNRKDDDGAYVGHNNSDRNGYQGKDTAVVPQYNSRIPMSILVMFAETAKPLGGTPTAARSPQEVSQP